MALSTPHIVIGHDIVSCFLVLFAAQLNVFGQILVLFRKLGQSLVGFAGCWWLLAWRLCCLCIVR